MALADWANLAGLVGVGLLAYPALIVNRYARLLARLARIPRNSDDPTAAELRARTEDGLIAIRDGWSFGKSLCLIGGTALAALSYALPLFPVLWHLVVPAAIANGG